MAEATRAEAREVTESRTATDVRTLKPGDVVTGHGPYAVVVDRTETVPGKVTLELTEDEAQFLADIMSMVGGDMAKSRRRFQTEMADALAHVGITFESHKDLRGSIVALGGLFHPPPD